MNPPTPQTYWALGLPFKYQTAVCAAEALLFVESLSRAPECRGGALQVASGVILLASITSALLTYLEEAYLLPTTDPTGQGVEQAQIDPGAAASTSEEATPAGGHAKPD